MKTTKRRVVANWKMNGVASDLIELEPINAWAAGRTDVIVDVALPATLIGQAARIFSSLRIGAQDVHVARSGSYTGGISAEMVADAGAQFAIIGHSETRLATRANHALVPDKIDRAIEANLDVVLCVGETAEQRSTGCVESVVCSQLAGDLEKGVPSERLIIAYEPIWAIGTGRVPSATLIDTMHRSLKSWFRDGLSGPVELLYGGSVSSAVINDVLSLQSVDGVLVGTASLSSSSFLAILDATAACVRDASSGN